jgi:integrase
MASISSYIIGSGEKRWLVRWRDARKKQHGKSFTRKRDAERYAADLERRRQLGPLYEAEPETFEEFLRGWIVRYRQRVRRSSADRRAAAFTALPPELLARPLVSLTTAEVEDAVTEIAARAPRQAELALASVKLVLKDARRRGHRIAEAILELHPPRVGGRTPRFLTWPEVEHLAGVLPDQHARLVLVAALTGLRRGEILALTWGDVDLEGQTVTVREGKTEAARRTVDLAPTAVELLEEQRSALSEGGPPQADLGHAPPAEHAGRNVPAPSSESAPVFPNNRGGQWNGHNFYTRVFAPAARAAGFPDLTFHDLRHTYASLLAAANVNPKMAGALLGHADGGALFLRRYSHLYPGAGRQAADALERTLGKPQRADSQPAIVQSVRNREDNPNALG